MNVLTLRAPFDFEVLPACLQEGCVCPYWDFEPVLTRHELRRVWCGDCGRHLAQQAPLGSWSLKTLHSLVASRNLFLNRKSKARKKSLKVEAFSVLRTFSTGKASLHEQHLPACLIAAPVALQSNTSVAFVQTKRISNCSWRSRSTWIGTVPALRHQGRVLLKLCRSPICTCWHGTMECLGFLTTSSTNSRKDLMRFFRCRRSRRNWSKLFQMQLLPIRLPSPSRALAAVRTELVLQDNQILQWKVARCHLTSPGFWTSRSHQLLLSLWRGLNPFLYSIYYSILGN